jgi:hypothetical protein
MTNNVNVLAPFGPRIAKLKIPKNLINKINKEIDKIVDNQNLSKRFDYSKELVGQVSQELQLPKTFKIFYKKPHKVIFKNLLIKKLLNLTLKMFGSFANLKMNIILFIITMVIFLALVILKFQNL